MQKVTPLDRKLRMLRHGVRKPDSQDRYSYAAIARYVAEMLAKCAAESGQNVAREFTRGHISNLFRGEASGWPGYELTFGLSLFFGVPESYFFPSEAGEQEYRKIRDATMLQWGVSHQDLREAMASEDRERAIAELIAQAETAFFSTDDEAADRGPIS